MARVEGFNPDSTEQDGLYEKYRVFREPTRDSQGKPVSEHPVPIDPPVFRSAFTDRGGNEFAIVTELEEITDEFVFVLKPSTDRHARTALAAYAWSVRDDKPILHADLVHVLQKWVWDEGDEETDEPY